MKKQFLKRMQLPALAAGLFFMVSCGGGESAEHEGHDHSEMAEGEEMEAAPESSSSETTENPPVVDSPITAYLSLKNALVATDAAAAKTAAEALVGFSEGEIKTAAEALAASSDVEDQRAQFKIISEKMYASLKEGGATQALYKQYCPMAFDNTGAFWLSAEKEINNPYFGDKMLHCGEVQEELAVN